MTHYSLNYNNPIEIVLNIYPNTHNFQKTSNFISAFFTLWASRSALLLHVCGGPPPTRPNPLHKQRLAYRLVNNPG